MANLVRTPTPIPLICLGTMIAVFSISPPWVGVLQAQHHTQPATRSPRNWARLTIPRRSRAVGANHFISSRTFRKTIVHFRKQLSRNTYQFNEQPVAGYKQVLLSRFLATDNNPNWNAVHIFRIQGKTHIFIVPPKTTP